MRILNPWVGYVTRSFEQIKDNVLNRFQNLVPEITDHTESNPWVKGISIWSGMVEMIGYYLDNKARETFLPTARKFSSGVKIARLFGYRVKGTVSAFVDLTFTINQVASSDIIIPINTLCVTREGVEFRTLQNAIIPSGQTFVQVSARQWTPVISENIGTSNGSVNQSYDLVENVVDGATSVLVGLNSYQPVDTFAYSVPSDPHFLAGLNENSVMTIEFSDGVAGEIPAAGSDIFATYYTSLGSSGNVGATTIDEISSSITLPVGVDISVNNILGANGGADSENLEDLRKNIPRSLRTKDRAVTDQDFIDIAELVPGVAKAGQEYDCGEFVDVFIAPEGGGFPSNQLVQDVEDYFEDRRIITVKVRVQGAGEINIRIDAVINALPNYTNSDVSQRVTDNLLDFLRSENQEVRGTVFLSDIYEVIERTEGVSNSEISIFSPTPFARPVSGTTNILNWSPILKTGSVETVNWSIRFVSNSTFELSRNGQFLSTFQTNVDVVLPEIDFIINADGNNNDRYDFITYEFNGRRIVLDEPSIPVSDLANINLNVTGGID